MKSLNVDATSRKKDKRGINQYDQQALNIDFLYSFPSLGSQLWNQANIRLPLWDLTFRKLQSEDTQNLALHTIYDTYSNTPSNTYSPDIIRAIQFAKEANYNVHLAQHKVDEAKQAAIIQQNIALAKETAAQEAAHKSAEIAAHAKTEARSSVKQLVALQQRLAILKDSVAAAQRLAAARKTAAAAAIQRNAANTAAELHKQEIDNQVSESEHDAKMRDLILAKENTILHTLHNNAEQNYASIRHIWG